MQKIKLLINRKKMYTESILWLLSWPLLIFITYKLVLVALKNIDSTF
jgi:hypothetical protein